MSSWIAGTVDLIQSRPDVHELVRRDYTFVDGSFSKADREMLRSCFDHWERFRILCLTRVSRTTGADRVNAVLHQRLLDELGLTPQRHHDFIAGEPVMMQVNDYNRGDLQRRPGSDIECLRSGPYAADGRIPAN